MKKTEFWKNPIYTPNKVEVATVQKTHQEPKDLADKLAFLTVRALRVSIDVVSGFSFGKLTETKVLRRVL